MSKPKIIIAAVAILIVLIVALQNLGSVEASILFLNLALPLAVLLLLTFAMGILAGLLLAVSLSGRRSRKGKAKAS